MPRLLLLLATVLLALGLQLPAEAPIGLDALAAAEAEDCDCCPPAEADEADCCTWDLGACHPTLVAAATAPRALPLPASVLDAPPADTVPLPPHDLLERDTGPPPTPPPIG